MNYFAKVIKCKNFQVSVLDEDLQSVELISFDYYKNERVIKVNKKELACSTIQGNSIILSANQFSVGVFFRVTLTSYTYIEDEKLKKEIAEMKSNTEIK